MMKIRKTWWILLALIVVAFALNSHINFTIDTLEETVGRLEADNWLMQYKLDSCRSRLHNQRMSYIDLLDSYQTQVMGEDFDPKDWIGINTGGVKK